MTDQTGGSSDWQRAILHLDMDAFFVNVHLLSHPEDAGQPVVVGGSPEGRGVVAAASYEARAFGIHSAMPARTAVRLCPGLKFVRHDWPRIRDSSKHVMTVLREYGAVEPVSVDEAYLDLSERDAPASLAAEVQQRVIAETRLPASIGLATSKLVAKVASDHGKPRGHVVVPPGTEAEFLAPLSDRVIRAIG